MNFTSFVAGVSKIIPEFNSHIQLFIFHPEQSLKMRSNQSVLKIGDVFFLFLGVMQVN